MKMAYPWATLAAAWCLTVVSAATGQVIDNPFVKTSPEKNAASQQVQSVSPADATPAIPKTKPEFQQVPGTPRSEYQQFQRSVATMISNGSEVAANDRERSDIRTLQWLSRELQKHVDAGDWNRAAEVKQRMQVAIQRSQVVAADAPRRKAEQEERRHRELVAQRERQHQEEMAQSARQNQAIINQLQFSSAAARSSAPTTYSAPVPPTIINYGYRSRRSGK
jgi:hypothetical protein